MITLTTVLMVGIHRKHEVLEAAWKHFILGGGRTKLIGMTSSYVFTVSSRLVHQCCQVFRGGRFRASAFAGNHTEWTDSGGRYITAFDRARQKNPKSAAMPRGRRNGRKA